MASVSQGFSAAWNSVVLGEIVNVSIDGYSADMVDVTPRTSTARGRKFSPSDVDKGTVTLTLRGLAAMSVTNVGVTASLALYGPGISLAENAAFQSLSWSAGIGELQTYNVTFKLGT